MNQTEILVVGGNKEQLRTAVRLINTNEQWKGLGVSTDEEAIEKFHQHSFDVVVLMNGISEEEEKKLRKLFTHQQPDVIIQNDGGNSRLLSDEIMKALGKRQRENKPIVLFTDDALKNAGLNIIIQ